MANQLNIYRGTRAVIAFSIVDGTGAAFDLTGYTVTLIVKKNEHDDDSDAIITEVASVPVPATGTGSVILTVTDTDLEEYEYHYRIKIDDGASDRDIQSPIVSTLTILPA